MIQRSPPKNFVNTPSAAYLPLRRDNAVPVEMMMSRWEALTNHKLTANATAKEVL